MANTEGLVHHIEIYVSDLQKSINFWKELLESLHYTKFQDWSEGKSWKRGETYIVFVQTEVKYLAFPYHRSHTGLNHLAFHVASKEALDHIAQNLYTKGFKILYDDKFRKEESTDPYSVFFEDPDRIKVELVLSGN